MPKAYDTVKRVKDHRRINHLVVVVFAKVFDLSETTLIEFEIVLLKTKGNLLK